MPITKNTQKSKGERSGMPRRYILMTILCSLFLVVGFFFAASQHFSAMKYGMKNSALRKQIDELETEKRQLMLAKEIALSPAEIKKAAKKMGLTAMTASNIEVFRGAGNPPEQNKTEKVAAVKTNAKPSENSVGAPPAPKKAPEKEAKAEKKAEKKAADMRERTVNSAR
jgi:hypothetical protein